MVVAAGPTALSRVERGVTRAVVNADLQPDRQLRDESAISISKAKRCSARSAAAIGDGNLDFIDATGIATALMGDSIATNLFMLGFAFQKG